MVGSILATEPRNYVHIVTDIYSHTYQYIQIYDMDICIDLCAYICMLYKYIYKYTPPHRDAGHKSRLSPVRLIN